MFDALMLGFARVQREIRVRGLPGQEGGFQGLKPHLS